MIRVGVTGSLGKMGTQTCLAISESNNCELVAKVDINNTGADTISFSSIEELNPQDIDVIVDFTHYESAKNNINWCIKNNVKIVVGSTGFSQQDLDYYSTSKSLIAIIPNFAIGAVLMMHFAQVAAPYFESGEIIEYHHPQKKDAPSGTAKHTAEKMVLSSNSWNKDNTETFSLPKEMGNSRGANFNGVSIHSVRMEGMIAHQDVILGGHGETITIRHDSYSRESFMPGVLLCVENICSSESKYNNGLVVGLESFLNL